MNLNLYTFALEVVTFGAIFVLAIMLPYYMNGADTNSQCRMILTFDVVYWFIWVTLITRTCVTSYMNVKFSRDLRKTNREFYLVFNQDYTQIKNTVQANQMEDMARKKANRLSAFNEEYANQQMTRIITSFLRDDDSFTDPMALIEE